MPTTYPFRCACGAELRAAATDAGTLKTCGCGASVQVPSLARLKAAVGEASASADLQVEQLLAAGRLPLEPDCVVCGRATDHRVRTVVTCEKEEAVRQRWGPMDLLGLFTFGVLTWLVVRHADRPTGTRGTDRVFDLPMRVCEPCGRGLTTAADARRTLLRTPLYADLLDKYPLADVGKPRET